MTVASNDAAWFAAAVAPKPDALRKLVVQGANIDARDAEGFTALHLAAMNARADAVELLLSHGADPNARARSGSSALHLALSARSNINDKELAQRTRAARCLVEHGVELECNTGLGTALWDALYLAHGKAKELVAFLLERGANVLSTGRDGYSILHIASGFGHANVVEAALAAGADVNAREDFGGTALLHAANGGFVPIVERLLAAGADPNLASKRGKTPLHAVAEQGHVDVAATLIAKGAEVALRDDDGESPLDVAVWARQGRVAELLLDRGSPTDSALQAIAINRPVKGTASCAALAKLLLAKGADPNGRSPTGQTPLQALLGVHPYWWQLDAVLALVAAGADLDVEVTPLEMATTTARKLLSEDPPSACDARAAKPFARVRELVAKRSRSR